MQVSLLSAVNSRARMLRGRLLSLGAVLLVESLHEAQLKGKEQRSMVSMQALQLQLQVAGRHQSSMG